MDFHETVMGHRFFEETMPRLIRAVNALKDKLPSEEFIQFEDINGMRGEFKSSAIVGVVESDNQTEIHVRSREKPFVTAEDIRDVLAKIEHEG